MQKSTKRPSFQISSGRQGLHPQKTPEAPEPIQPVQEKQPDPLMKVWEEIEKLNNTGYYRYHLLAMLSNISQNLDGIGKLLSQIGESMSREEEQEEEEEPEEQEEQEEEE